MGQLKPSRLLCYAYVRCSPAGLAFLVDTWTTVSSTYNWQLTPGLQFGRSFWHCKQQWAKYRPWKYSHVISTPRWLHSINPNTLLSPTQNKTQITAKLLMTLHWFNSFNQILWLTVSNAFFRSRNTGLTTFTLSN